MGSDARNDVSLAKQALEIGVAILQENRPNTAKMIREAIARLDDDADPPLPMESEDVQTERKMLLATIEEDLNVIKSRI